MNCRISLAVALAVSLLPVPSAAAQDNEPGLDDRTRNCVGTRRIRRTKIVDDRNVLIYLSAKLILHNRLRQLCPGLEQAGTFAFTSTDGAVCKGDGLAPLKSDPWGPIRPIPTCWLGVHRQISSEEADEMILAAMTPPNQTPSPRPLPMPEPAEVGVEEDIEPE
jgi:hypothetical protein